MQNSKQLHRRQVSTAQVNTHRRKRSGGYTMIPAAANTCAEYRSCGEGEKGEKGGGRDLGRRKGGKVHHKPATAPAGKPPTTTSSAHGEGRQLETRENGDHYASQPVGAAADWGWGKSNVQPSRKVTDTDVTSSNCRTLARAHASPALRSGLATRSMHTAESISSYKDRPGRQGRVL